MVVATVIKNIKIIIFPYLVFIMIFFSSTTCWNGKATANARGNLLKIWMGVMNCLNNSSWNRRDAYWVSFIGNLFQRKFSLFYILFISLDLCFNYFSDVRKNQQRIEYLIEQRDDIPPIIVPSVEGFVKWPQLIFQYLENNVFFVRATNSDETTITESANVIGQPMNISCKLLIVSIQIHS